MISRATEEENKRTKGKQAIEVVKRERYFDSTRGIHGVYTEKVCNVRNFLPGFIKVFVPETNCILIEKVRLLRFALKLRCGSYVFLTCSIQHFTLKLPTHRHGMGSQITASPFTKAHSWGNLSI